MPSSITVTNQVIEIGSVDAIEITDRITDPDSGKFYRDIRIMGKPPLVEQSVNFFTLRVKADFLENLLVIAPAQTF